MKRWFRFTAIFLMLFLAFSCIENDEFMTQDDEALQLKKADSGNAGDRYIVIFRDDVTDPDGVT
ncbi:MAG TPA: hypothetical protein PK582_03465, partial [Prolixibacteraceae bacterium]|nr:hypothetical protein [Prolixibacteraceae bacterium]